MTGALRVIARLVPRADRDAWLREWEAEFTYALGRPDLGQGARIRIGTRLWSAFAHACWLRQEAWAMGSIAQDIRFAARLLRRQPALTVAVVVTLAFGIGVNAAVFGVLRAAMLRPLAVADLDRVVVAWQTNPQNGNLQAVFSYPDYRDWIGSAHGVDRTALLSKSVSILTGLPDPGRVQAAAVTPGFFELLGRAPRGRTFTDADQIPTAERVAIVSEAFARQHLPRGTDLDARITLDGVPRRIVGVIAADALAAVFAPATDVWVPLVLRPQVVEGRGNRNYLALAHLAPHATVAAAQAEFSTVMTRLARD